MKRALPSFTVEIRRQQKRAPVGTNLGRVQTKPVLTAFGEEQRSPTAAEIRKVGAPASEPAAPRRTGRILPDLSEIEPESSAVVEASSSSEETIRAIASTRGRKFRPTTDTGQIGRPRGRPKSPTSEKVSPMTSPAIAAEPLSAGRLGGSSSIVRSRPSAPSSPFVPPGSTGVVDDVSANVGVTRDDKPRTFSESPQVPPSREESRPLIAADAPSGETPPVAEGSQRRGRQRKILGRYVLGDDLKPGERWKRRLPKGALR